MGGLLEEYLQQTYASRRAALGEWVSGVSATNQLPTFAKSSLIGDGGFGRLYVDPRDTSNCIKVLKKPLTGVEFEHFRLLVDVQRWARPSTREFLLSRFAWPIEIFTRGDSMIAYAMPLAPDESYFELTAANRTERKPLQLKYLTDDDYWRSAAISSEKPKVSADGRLDILVEIHDALTLLHGLGFSYGDLSSNNLVARLPADDSVAGVFFFDADSITPFAFREATPLISAGFETPIGLDAASIDRSRFAVLVLRMLTERPSVMPGMAPSLFQPSTVDSDIVMSVNPLIDRCYASGSEDAFEHLGIALRQGRSQERQVRAFVEAIASGWACRVLAEAPSARNKRDLAVLDQARAQDAFEERIEGASGDELRKLIRRHGYLRGQWRLDVVPRLGLGVPPRSEAELVDLIYDAMFEEIALHLVQSDLGDIARHPLMARSIEHAIAIAPQPSGSIEVRPGEATLRMAWPAAPYVNSIRLQVTSGGQSYDQWLDRSSPELERVITAPRGADLRVVITAGVRSSAGFRVAGQSAMALSATVPPAPVPVVARRNRAIGSGIASGIPPMASIVSVVDPVEQREQQRVAKRRHRRRVLLASGAPVLLTAIGAFWLIRDHSGATQDYAGSLDVGGGKCRITFASPPPPFNQARVWSMGTDGSRVALPNAIVAADGTVTVPCERYLPPPVLEVQPLKGATPVGPRLVVPNEDFVNVVMVASRQGITAANQGSGPAGIEVRLRSLNSVGLPSRWLVGDLDDKSPLVPDDRASAIELQVRFPQSSWQNVNTYRLRLRKSDSRSTGMSRTPTVLVGQNVASVIILPSRRDPRASAYVVRYSSDAGWQQVRFERGQIPQIPIEGDGLVRFEVRSEFVDGSLGPWVPGPAIEGGT